MFVDYWTWFFHSSETPLQFRRLSIIMTGHDKLDANYRKYFKNLKKRKPDLDFHGKKIKWDDMVKNIKILSEPVSAKNQEKLTMQKGLPMCWVSDDRGKFRAPTTRRYTLFLSRQVFFMLLEL